MIKKLILFSLLWLGANKASLAESLTDVINVALWSIAPMDDPGDQYIFVTKAVVRLTNGNIVPTTLTATKAFRALNSSQAREYQFRLVSAVNVSDIECIGIFGTGSVFGYKISCVSEGKTRPLYYLPSLTNKRSYLVLNDREPAWVSSLFKVNKFIEREATFTCNIMDAVSASSWLYAEIELVDGDFLIFKKQGPFSANSKIKVTVPAPYSLTEKNIAQVRICNARTKTDSRRWEENKYSPAFFQYQFFNEVFTLTNVKFGYTEIGFEILKSEVLFETPLVRVNNTGGGELGNLRRKQIDQMVNGTAILFQIITGEDDLRINTKYAEHSSVLRGELAVTGIPQTFASGETIKTGFIFQLDNPLYYSWDEVGFQKAGAFGAKGAISAGYYNLDETKILRNSIPFLRYFMLQPNNNLVENPFSRSKMASMAIPVPRGCPVAYASSFVLYPKLGRGAKLNEQAQPGLIGLNGDNWDLKGVIISYWTEQGWRRIYSRFSGVNHRFLSRPAGQPTEEKVFNLADQMEKTSISQVPGTKQPALLPANN